MPVAAARVGFTRRNALDAVPEVVSDALALIAFEIDGTAHSCRMLVFFARSAGARIPEAFRAVPPVMFPARLVSDTLRIKIETRLFLF